MAFAPCPYFFRVPHGVFLREATSVAVNSKDEVIVFNRGNMPVLIFSPAGELVDMFGNPTPFAGTRAPPPELVASGVARDGAGTPLPVFCGCCYSWAHSVRCDGEDNMWLVDVLGHRIHKVDRSGRTLLTLGSGQPCAPFSGELFNRPTDVAIHPRTGELFVTDGYRNARVHRLDAAGRHIQSWGTSGSDPGQFSLPHSIDLLDEEHVIVCDRENHRVQVFTLEGGFVRQWPVHKATAVRVVGRGEATRVYVAEQGPSPVMAAARAPNLGQRVGIYTREGALLHRLGEPLPGEGPAQFLWPHSIAVDSKGCVFVAEVSYVEVRAERRRPPPLPAACLPSAPSLLLWGLCGA